MHQAVVDVPVVEGGALRRLGCAGFVHVQRRRAHELPQNARLTGALDATARLVHNAKYQLCEESVCTGTCRAENPMKKLLVILSLFLLGAAGVYWRLHAVQQAKAASAKAGRVVVPAPVVTAVVA